MFLSQEFEVFGFYRVSSLQRSLGKWWDRQVIWDKHRLSFPVPRGKVQTPSFDSYKRVKPQIVLPVSSPQIPSPLSPLVIIRDTFPSFAKPSTSGWISSDKERKDPRQRELWTCSDRSKGWEGSQEHMARRERHVAGRLQSCILSVEPILHTQSLNPKPLNQEYTSICMTHCPREWTDGNIKLKQTER